MPDMIKAVIQRPGQISQIITIPNTLEALQQLVGGYIETLTLPDGFVIICNEEGRYLGLQPNVNTYAGVIVGNIIITKEVRKYKTANYFNFILLWEYNTIYGY